MLAAIQWAHVSTKNGRMNERALANRSDGAHRLAVSLFISKAGVAIFRDRVVLLDSPGRRSEASVTSGPVQTTCRHRPGRNVFYGPVYWKM